MRENRAAFERTFLRPRYLVDVSSRDLTTTVLGTKIAFPLLLSPTGYHTLSHPEGECETARGAGVLGVPMMVSTVRHARWEMSPCGNRSCLVAGYMMEDDEVNQWLLKRAERTGCRAIVLTVDAQFPGNRERTGATIWRRVSRPPGR